MNFGYTVTASVKLGRLASLRCHACGEGEHRLYPSEVRELYRVAQGYSRLKVGAP